MKRIIALFLSLFFVSLLLGQAGRVKQLAPGGGGDTTFVGGIVAPVDTNKLWQDGNEDGIPKLWNPFTGQYDAVKFDFEVDSIGQILNKKYPLGSRITSNGLDGKGEAIYLIQSTNSTGIIPDSLGVIPVGSGFAVLSGLLDVIPNVELKALGVKKSDDYSDLIEKYINAFPSVTAVFPNDTLQLLDIYIADNNRVELEFENTVILMPEGVVVDIVDDSMHIFNFKNVDDIYIHGAATFDHSDTTRFSWTLPPKWTGIPYQSNQVFHIEAGSNYEQHREVRIEGDYRGAFKLVDGWYNAVRVVGQVPEFSFTRRSYDLVRVQNFKTDLAINCFSTRGNFGKAEMLDCDVITDQYKNFWSLDGMGRNGFTQEVSAQNDMDAEIRNCVFTYDGFFSQNIQDLWVDNIQVNKRGYWYDQITGADSIIWSEFIIDSLTAETDGYIVRSAGGPGIKVDNAIYGQGSEVRTALINNVRFRNTINEDEYPGAADATNLQFEGEDLDSKVINSHFDDELVYGGSPGFARAPIITNCTFYANAQVIATDGFTMDHCVFRDSFQRNSNAFIVDAIDTTGAWEQNTAWSPTGGGSIYPVRISNTNFYSRKINLQNNRPGYAFSNCNFYDYSGIVMGDGTSNPDTIKYNISFDNCYGGRIRVPFGWTNLTDSSYIDIRNHKDLLITEANWNALVKCPSCDINNVDILDYSNGVPHDQSAYRADLSARSLVQDYDNYPDRIIFDKQISIDRSAINNPDPLIKLLPGNSSANDTALIVTNTTGTDVFRVMNDGKFITQQTGGGAISQFWGNNWAVTTAGGSIATLNFTGGTFNAQFSQFRSANTGYTFFSDSNTGMYRIDADRLGFRTNNVLGFEVNAFQHLLGNGRFFEVDNPSGGTDSLQATIDSIDVRLDELETTLLPTSQGTSATTASPGTTLVITHNLGQAPTYISITPGGDIGDWYVNTINSTTMTLNYTSTATTTANSVNIYWQVE